MTTLKEYNRLNSIIDSMKPVKTESYITDKPLLHHDKICVDCGSTKSQFDSSDGSFKWYRVRNTDGDTVGYRCKNCYYRLLRRFKNPNLKPSGKYGPYALMGISNK